MNATDLARKFHETYEQLAPDFGYETRKDSAVPWENVPERNRNLMVAVCESILKEKPVSILQDWVTQLGLRHQGVLLTAIRGCDSSPKEDLVKPVVRAVRYQILIPFDCEEVLRNSKGFMYYVGAYFSEDVLKLSKNMDQYPLHFIMHLIHAIEVIGYCHPEYGISSRFYNAYKCLVKALHFNAETKEEMDTRLNEDRKQL